MEDVQSRPDMRGIHIPSAGVSDLRYPISVSVGGSVQTTIGSFKMSVSVAADQKGTHMSRFVEIVNAFHGREMLGSIQQFTDESRRRLDAHCACVDVEFPFFVSREAPVTTAAALLEYPGRIRCRSSKNRDPTVELGVVVPITTVCPCSKTISEYGAHNQRGSVTILVSTSTALGLHELIDYAEASASCRVYPVVKRADERHITMRAYDHPQFVEDVMREVSLFLQADSRVEMYAIDVANAESIHNHSVFASSTWARVPQHVPAAVVPHVVEQRE